MPVDIPTPFQDLDLPPRKPGQKEGDLQRNREQTDLLRTGIMSSGAGDRTVEQSDEGEEGRDELYDLLVGRRTVGRAVVQFEAAPTDTGQSSLVVPRQLLVRHPDGSDVLPPEVDQLLNSNSFTVEPALTSLVCPDLAGKLSVYTYTGEDETRFDAARTAMTVLQGSVVRAAPTLVTALHQPPPPPPAAAPAKTIVKAAIGPAPTTVDEDDQAFHDAGLRPPEGTTIVAVIDTGIADIERTDGWLREVPRDPGCIDPLDAFPPPGNGFLDFAAGHGTFAAGIVRLVDPDTQIKVYATLDSDGFATENDIACAMIQAVRDGAHVLNLSLGMQRRAPTSRPAVRPTPAVGARRAARSPAAPGASGGRRR